MKTYIYAAILRPRPLSATMRLSLPIALRIIQDKLFEKLFEIFLLYEIFLDKIFLTILKDI